MKRPLHILTLVALAAAATTTTAAAQPGPGVTRSYAQVYRLKPDMVEEWISLQRNEVIPAQKKAGVASRTTLVTAVGDSYEYVVLVPFAEWSLMDGPNPLVRALGEAGAAALNAKLRRCILTQTTYMTNRRDSLTVPATDAPIWRFAISRITPGKQAEYLAWYRTDMLPAAQKAKAMGHNLGTTLSLRGVGATAGEVVVVTHFARFADLDKPPTLTAALGAAEAAKANERGAGLTSATRTVIRRRIADLSY
jgi:antibiotic biosynthesis monooxygenase (ABM) superfamily enzyme